MQINRANFLTWYKDLADEFVPLPIPYSNICASPQIAWIIGDTMSFIVNEQVPISSSHDYTLYLCDLQGNEIDTIDIMEVFISDLDPLAHYIYGTFTCPDVAVGDYLLKIDNVATTYFSNKISVFNDEALLNTAKYKFRHKFLKNNVEYSNEALASFYQEFRLFSSFGEMNNQSSKEIINDIDSQVPREYNTSVSMGYKCSVFGLDVDKHQAVLDMITCSELEINGRRYQSDGSYSPSKIGKSGLSTGTFNVQDYSLRYARR